jgi:hypothetical protein
MVPVTWNSNGNDIKISIFWIVLDLVDRYGISVTQMTTDMFTCRKHFPFLSLLEEFEDTKGVIRIRKSKKNR